MLLPTMLKIIHSSYKYNNVYGIFEAYPYIFPKFYFDFFRAMAQRPPSSRIAARNEATDLMGVLCGMMES